MLCDGVIASISFKIISKLIGGSYDEIIRKNTNSHEVDQKKKINLLKKFFSK